MKIRIACASPKLECMLEMDDSYSFIVREVLKNLWMFVLEDVEMQCLQSGHAASLPWCSSDDADEWIDDFLSKAVKRQAGA